MADNLEILKQNLDLAINPNAGPGQILAQSHNDYVTEFINKQGKYVGMPFIVKTGFVDTCITGELFFDNPLNEPNQFTIICSKYNADLNDMTVLLGAAKNADILHFKDFSGRSCLYKFKNFTEGVDNFGNPIIYISLTSFPNNPNYSYQPNETKIGVFELITKTRQTIAFLELQVYKAENNILDSLEINDVASGWITNSIFIPFGQYLGGQIDDVNSWNSSPFTF